MDSDSGLTVLREEKGLVLASDRNKFAIKDIGRHWRFIVVLLPYGCFAKVSPHAN